MDDRFHRLVIDINDVAKIKLYSGKEYDEIKDGESFVVGGQTVTKGGIIAVDFKSNMVNSSAIEDKVQELYTFESRSENKSREELIDENKFPNGKFKEIRKGDGVKMDLFIQEHSCKCNECQNDWWDLCESGNMESDPSLFEGITFKQLQLCWKEPEKDHVVGEFYKPFLLFDNYLLNPFIQLVG